MSLLELDDTQSELLGPLLATALSPEGLLEARGVMKHENILRRVETEAGVANASRRDPGKYYTTVFGKLRARARPGRGVSKGHHLSINVTQLPGAPPDRGAAVHRCESGEACCPAPRPAFGCWPPKKTWDAN